MLISHLATSLTALGIPLSDAQREQFQAFHEMLLLANRRMNLTRVALDDPREAADHHYVDSIAPMGVAAMPRGGRMIDVGAGAGFPGVPLAIMNPDIEVTLLDSLKKRVNFLGEVIRELGLSARAVHMRAEDAAHDAAFRERFDLVTARAVAALPVLLEWTLPFAKVGGQLWAYKGPGLQGELPAAQNALRTLGAGEAHVHQIHIPGRDWEHRLLTLQKARPTPKPYPRKPAEITKRTL